MSFTLMLCFFSGAVLFMMCSTIVERCRAFPEILYVLLRICSGGCLLGGVAHIPWMLYGPMGYVGIVLGGIMACILFVMIIAIANMWMIGYDIG